MTAKTSPIDDFVIVRRSVLSDGVPTPAQKDLLSYKQRVTELQVEAPPHTPGTEQKEEKLQASSAPGSNGHLVAFGMMLKGQSNSRGMRGVGLKSNLSNPPELEFTPFVKHTFRFKSSSVDSSIVTLGSLLTALGGWASSTTTFHGWASSVKIHKISIWPALSTTGNAPVELVWFTPISGVGKDDVKGLDLPSGISVSSASVYVPPPKTLCADWMSGSDNNLLSLSSPIGSIVDVLVSFTLTNSLNGATLTSSFVGSDFGYNPLDSSGNYVPLHLPQP